MREDTVPEVLRVNLANVLLELKVMGVRDVVNFDFMERPERSAILSALKELYFLGALDADGVLTVLGQQMCRFPLEPSYSKALISALLMRCEEEMVTVVSLLSAENVWARPPRIRAEEYALFEKTLHDFADLDGDHATLLQIYKRW
jgi:ATP-dependent RNA helicase DHX8/PRP22